MDEKSFPTQMIVALNEADARLHDVYHLDLVSGELDKVVENFGVAGWVADPELSVRGALRHRSDSGIEVLARGPGAGPDGWETVLSVDAEDALGTRVGFQRRRKGALPAVVGRRQHHPAAVP